MKKLKAFSLALTMAISFLSVGQEKTISGVVSDNSGALPGANVVVRGTKTGTQTDMDGKYSIKTKVGDILVFSFVGYADATAKVGHSNVINVKLHASQNLEEVVVTGAMGIKRRKDAVTSSYQVTSSKELTQSANPNVIRALTGKVSGLQINLASNSNTRKVLIGTRTISGNAETLIVIDGKISTADELSKISPDDIESVNVIKGAQGTALYGEQGENGVIIAKLKKPTISPNPVIPTDEDYNSLIENEFESPVTEPLSTFSIDVDNASYTNIRRFINEGQTVPKDAVRVEEMVNFFKYKYPQPTDNHPFSINTEYSNCPWNAKHQLLKIGLQGRNIDAEKLPNSNLVFLIDVSGSMGQQNKLPLLIQSLKVLVEQLRKEDKVSIVVYAGAAGLVLPSTAGNDKKTIIDALEKLQSGGSTAGGAGINLAYKIAEENFIKEGNNRVILATDGDFNVGSSSDYDMQSLIETKRKSGVFLTCLGYGMGNYKDSKMEILADKGNGNYAYIDNIQEANRFLGKEFKGSMFTIAKDVKIQIEFNPKQVQSYRLIGYENRKLRPEDFKNDAIDAGELGSGHTVTALYEIIPTGVESEFQNSQINLKYTKVDSVSTNYSDELATVKFRYKKPDGDTSTEMVSVIENKVLALEKVSDDMRFSAAVAWFGLKLRDSKLVSNKSSADIKKLAKSGIVSDDEGYKAEFVRLVEAVK